MRLSRWWPIAPWCAFVLVFAHDVHAQDMQMNMPMKSGWAFMQDGIVFAEFNHQGGPRGGEEESGLRSKGPFR